MSDYIVRATVTLLVPPAHHGNHHDAAVTAAERWLRDRLHDQGEPDAIGLFAWQGDPDLVLTFEQSTK